MNDENNKTNTEMECADIEKLIAERNEARDRRDFVTANRIRDELIDAGIAIAVGVDGTRWRRL